MSDKDQAELTRRSFFTGVTAGTLGGLVAGTVGTHALSSLQPKWHLVADVVVVGGGAAGCTAAMSAAEVGAKVIILESAPVLGGAGSLCIGSVTTPITSLQNKAGITDSAKAYVENVLEMAGTKADRMDMDLLRLLAANGGATLDWLLSLGVNIQGPFEYPGHHVRRMHLLIPRSAEWPKVFRPIFEKNGTKILMATKGLELYRDANNRVLGIKAMDQQTRRTLNIKARRAVVLTAGSLEGSRKLLSKVTTPEDAALPAAVPTNEGDGLIMAAALGADITLPHDIGVRGVRGMPPGPATDSIIKQAWMPYGMVDAGAIVVNKRGKRFINEEQHGTPMCIALQKQPDKVCHLIFDKRVADIFNKWPMVVGSIPGIGDVSGIGGWGLVNDLVARNGIREANTIEELALAVDVDPAGLKTEIDKWNRYCVEGKDPDCHRQTFGHKEANTVCAGIKVPPFYCHGPLRTLGLPAYASVAINTRLQVIDVFGRVIPGLYAGGNMGHGNLIFAGHGMTMAWAFTSGRLGGNNAAAEVFWG